MYCLHRHKICNHTYEARMAGYERTSGCESRRGNCTKNQKFCKETNQDFVKGKCNY